MGIGFDFGFETDGGSAAFRDFGFSDGNDVLAENGLLIGEDGIQDGSVVDGKFVDENSTEVLAFNNGDGIEDYFGRDASIISASGAKKSEATKPAGRGAAKNKAHKSTDSESHTTGVNGLQQNRAARVNNLAAMYGVKAPAKKK